MRGKLIFPSAANQSDYPATLNLTGYWKNFASIPWLGSPSAGNSGSHNFDNSNGATATVGSSFGTHPSAAMNGASSQYLTDTIDAVSDLITTTNFSMQWILSADSLDASNVSIDAEPAIWCDYSNSYFRVTVSSSGVRAGVYSGGTTAYIPIATNTKYCIQCGLSGGILRLRVNGGDWATVSTTAIAGGMTAHAAVGVSYDGAHRFTGKIAQFLTSKTNFSNATWDTLHVDAVANYSLSPTITSFNYSVVDTVGGYPVTINGFSLAGGTCTLGGSSVTVTATTANSLTFTMPTKAAGLYNVQVTASSVASNILAIDVENTPLLWLDADHAAVSGSNITTIPNTAKSSIDLSVSQATTANQPTFSLESASFNNKPAILHSGSSTQYLTSAILGSAVTQPLTFYAIADWNTVAYRYLFDSVNGAPRTALIDNNGSGLYAYAGSDIEGGTLTTGVAHCICVVFNGGSSAIYIDDMATAVVSGNAGAGGLQSLLIGGRYTIESFFDGAWSTIAAFGTAHDSTARSRQATQLKSKYGIS
jgi:hypothetical protein